MKKTFFIYVSFCFSLLLFEVDSADYTVKNMAELQAALLSNQQNNTKNTLILTEDIQLDAALPLLMGDLTIDGQGHAINGRQQFRVFSVDKGHIYIKNLDIVDGKSVGATSSSFHFGGGGGGAAGMGGGLFIRAGSVHLSAVHFIGNQAIGGAGGSYLSKEETSAGGDGAAFYFGPKLISSLAHLATQNPLVINAKSLFLDKIASQNKILTASPHLLLKTDKTPVITTIKPNKTDLKLIYRLGGQADNSGATGSIGDFGDGGGGGGTGYIDGGFGGTGGFGGGGGGGAYGYGFIGNHYSSDILIYKILNHADNSGAAGFAGGFGGRGGFADDSNGGSGGGGAGLGGAIFIQAGSLKLAEVRFSHNVASGGMTGQGQHQGEAGQGLAGALFICNKSHDHSCNAIVRVCNPPIYLKNIATTATANTIGQLLNTDCRPPVLTPIETKIITPFLDIDALTIKKPASIPKPAAIVLPPLNRKTFSWEGEAINSWSLWLGNRVGERNIYDSGRLDPEAQITVDKLPLDGSFMFSRLWYSKNNKNWYYHDYRYNLRANQWVEITLPGLLIDNTNNKVYGKKHTFHWQGSGIEQWRLSIGHRQGATDIYFNGHLNHKTAVTVQNLPADGQTIYLRLWFWHQQHGQWQTLDYQYISEPALMDIMP